jgi:hypothetical protein
VLIQTLLRLLPRKDIITEHYNFCLTVENIAATYCSTIPLSSGEIDEEEKEREHSSMQEKLDKELQELDKRLQQKEVLISCHSCFSPF